MSGEDSDLMLRDYKNKIIREKIKEVEKKIKGFERKIKVLKDLIIPPCSECLYDGVYRCEACEENDYDGYNIKDYP